MIVLPKQQMELLKQKMSAGQQKTQQTYQVKSGDTLGAIALVHGTTVDAIMRVNPQISDANYVVTGQIIVIGNDATTTDSASSIAPINNTTAMKKQQTDQVVQQCPMLRSSTDEALAGDDNDSDLPIDTDGFTYDDHIADSYELTSLFPQQQLYALARQLAEAPFISVMMTTFGQDIPVKTYQILYYLASEESLPDVPFKVVQGRIKGHLAAFDNQQNCIVMATKLVDDAIASNEGKAPLLAVVLEEYGHHLDYFLRFVLSETHGDAKQDEGAVFAYSLLSMESFVADQMTLATVTSGKFNGPLVFDNSALAAALAQVDEQEQQNDDRNQRFEFFGAGMGNAKDAKSHGHQSIELVLKQVGFSDDDLPRIYFGNWLRDFSQIVDPNIVRPADMALEKMQQNKINIAELDTTRLSREALTDLVSLLAAKEFAKHGEDMATFTYRYITPETLGVYRAEEHIDNPKSASNGTFDYSSIDVAFAPPYVEAQIETNPLTGLKNYINTPVAEQAFPTAVEYMTTQLSLAMAAGKTKQGMLHFGQALHVLEDYFSHSNFIEISLIKLGKRGQLATAELNALAAKVYPVVDVSAQRIPLVTGRFGQLDVIASVGPKLADLFKTSITDYEQAQPGYRSDTDKAVIIVLADLAKAQQADKTKGGTQYQGSDYSDYLAKYQTFLGYRDELLKKKSELIPALLLKSFHYIAQVFIVVANFAIHHMLETVAKNIDDIQTLLDEVGTDPTHSQLAKDHDDHPLHDLAAVVAQEAVLDVGKQMNDYWRGIPKSSPVSAAVNFIQHPEAMQLFDIKIAQWANQNQVKVETATFKGSIDEFTHRLPEQAAELREKLNSMTDGLMNAWEKVYDYFQD